MRELKENRRLHACQSKVVDEPPPVGNAATAKDSWTLWGLNPRPPACKAGALPLRQEPSNVDGDMPQHCK